MRRLHFFLLLLLAASVLWLLAGHWRGASLATSNPEVGARGAEPVSQPVSAAAQAAEQAAYQQQTKAWVERLEKLEVKKGLRARAAEKMDQTRGWLQRDRRDAWTALISTNRQTFLALRDAARHATNGETTCTICDGRGSLAFCILCSHSDGKCVTCGGAGRLSTGEVCPTCMGTGRCYLCDGTGRMTCPFCNDGLIRVNGPQPAQIMPLK
jgi:hypothetical protein